MTLGRYSENEQHVFALVSDQAPLVGKLVELDAARDGFDSVRNFSVEMDLSKGALYVEGVGVRGNKGEPYTGVIDLEYNKEADSVELSLPA